MRMITLILTLLAFGMKNAEAQTFSPEYDETPAVQTQTETAQPTSSNSGTNAASKKSDETESQIFVPAQVNIGGNKEKEKVYDNSEGHVFGYKYVNGKIIFTDSEDRKVLIFIDNYKAHKGMDGIVKCSLRVYVLNDMIERINNLSFKLIWPEIRTSIQMSRVNPGVKTYKDIMLLGDGCFSMDKTPTIEVNRCRVKGKSQEQCAQAVRWFRK